jgi:hypothetical protein
MARRASLTTHAALRKVRTSVFAQSAGQEESVISAYLMNALHIHVFRVGSARRLEMAHIPALAPQAGQVQIVTQMTTHVLQHLVPMVQHAWILSVLTRATAKMAGSVQIVRLKRCPARNLVKQTIAIKPMLSASTTASISTVSVT